MTIVQCLARIQATKNDGKVTVVYQAEHYGYPKELKHQPFSTETIMSSSSSSKPSPPEKFW